jgi:uncharacterized protein YdhG (YjbR/CyaY superfamily)
MDVLERPERGQFALQELTVRKGEARAIVDHLSSRVPDGLAVTVHVDTILSPVIASPRLQEALMAPKPKSKPKATTIDEYLAALPSDQRAALEKLRKTIRAAAPGVEECISYQIPGFRYRGKMLVWFGATANHCSFHPGATVQAFKADLAKYDTSTGTIRFQPDHPLPVTLVRKLVKARIAQNARPKPRG